MNSAPRTVVGVTDGRARGVWTGAMKGLDAEMMRLATTQEGIVERADLLSLGMTYGMIQTRVRRGSLLEIYPGAFRVHGAPSSWKGNLLAAQLSLGPTAVVSHRSAAAVYELEGCPPGVLELTTVGHKRRYLRGVHQHRAESVRQRDIRRLGRFRMSTPERVLLELGAVVRPRIVEAALDSALFKGLTSFARVKTFLSEVRRSGLNGVTTLAEILDDRDPQQSPAATIFETDFYRFLRNSHLPQPTFQLPVRDAEGLVGRLDVAYVDEKVGIEAHSLRWHSPRERVQKDAARHNRLAVAGWQVLYETYQDLNDRPHEILTRLGKVLAARSRGKIQA